MSSKVKKKRFRVKHQKVKLFRANEPLLSVFMWGVNHTINELSHVTIPVMLLPDDFRAYSKMKVDNHLFNKENMPSHYKIKEYCPLVFRNLRERFSIDDFLFKESLTRSEPIPIDSQGKSGAKFYESFNKLFVIKTLTSEEVERMHNFLKHYHQVLHSDFNKTLVIDSINLKMKNRDKIIGGDSLWRLEGAFKVYIVEHHGKTLLPQYLAMYRLTVDGIEHYLVIMRNVFSHHLKLHKKYDLKGSTVDREASEKEREKALPTFKDNDFIRDRMHITIGEDAKTKLFDTLSADVDFLTRLNLMDYSLLVGIHDRTKSYEEKQQFFEEAQQEGGGGGLGEEDDDADEPCSANDSDDSTVVVGQSVGGGSVSGGRQMLQMSPYNSVGGVGGGGEHKTPDFSSTPESPIVNNDYFPYQEEWPTTLYNDGDIEPRFDIYAIPSADSSVRNEIYFIALIDVLTTYGVRKQAAKAAKAVKYGGNVDGISTCDPEQYAKRFIDFISKSIE